MDVELLVRQKPECLDLWMLVTTPGHYVCGTTRPHPWATALHYHTNDIPYLAHSHTVSCAELAQYCHGCGGTVCYVDDSTFSLAATDPVALSSGLTEQCQVDYKCCQDASVGIGDKRLC